MLFTPQKTLYAVAAVLLYLCYLRLSRTQRVPADGALTYTLLVLLAGLLAKGRATGREAVVRVLLASGIMIAPEPGYVHILFQAPDQAGTCVPLLAILIAADLAPHRWFVSTAIGLLLIWVVIGDLLITEFASGSTTSASSWLTLEGVLGVYGADFLGMPLGLRAAIALLHLAGLSLAVWALCRAFRRFFRLDDMIAAVLAVAIVLNIVAYLFSDLPYTQISAILPFGAVLAGRLLAGDMLRARLVPAMAAILACYLAVLGYGLTQR